jgi:YD repeat-containing protein
MFERWITYDEKGRVIEEKGTDGINKTYEYIDD